MNKLKVFLKSVYDKLSKIDDTPQKIALGFGLGVFCGILPGTGPLAAVALAFVFRANKIAAFAGGLLTNSWLSIVTFVVAVKLGSAVIGADWNEVYSRCKEIIQHFHWKDLGDIPFSEIILPLFLGYLIVGLVSGVAAYFIAISIVTHRRKVSRHT